MKIRTGFVSNSSSSSFVVILPSNFIDSIKFEGNLDEEKIKKFKKFLDKFIKDEGYWRDSDNDDEEEYEFYDILSRFIRPYVVASIDTSSDNGDQIIILNREKIKKLLV